MTHRRSSLLLAAVAALTGCGVLDGGGTDCNLNACANRVTITATVPPIGTSKWTVEVCLNGYCDTSEITAATPVDTSVLASVELLETGKLVITGDAVQPKDGDLWRVTVTDAAQQVVVQGEKAVTYENYAADSCTTCKRASFSLP